MEEVILAQERARSNPLQFLVGSGPGTTASRAALLLTPHYMKPGSFFGDLPIEPTALALRFSVQTRTLWGGSAEDAQSSVLGVIGDLGLLGLLGLVLLFFGIYRASKRAGSWLVPAVAATLIMTFGLSFIDNWLEYPEYTVPLAILFGFATTAPSSGGPLRHDVGKGLLIAHSRGA
jgi:hypothetical protein